MMGLTIRKLLLAGCALALASCSGGGGGVSSQPRPQPTPTPVPATTPIVGAATTSQQFVGMGGTVTYFPEGAPPALSTSPASQLKVRYDAAAAVYEIQLPNGQYWLTLPPDAWNGNPVGGDPVYLSIVESAANGYDYSALAYWTSPGAGLYGGTAFGIETPASGVPTTGAATYLGQIAGYSTETYDWGGWGNGPATVEGSISLAFNFGAGTLSGSINPVIYGDSKYALSPLNFTHTVYSTGSANFSGRFDTNLTGANGFSGLFTGPGAQELIGSFAFPYQSLLDGKVYQAGGGFAGKTQ